MNALAPGTQARRRHPCFAPPTSGCVAPLAQRAMRFGAVVRSVEVAPL